MKEIKWWLWWLLTTPFILFFAVYLFFKIGEVILDKRPNA
jgi:hypothetical protein